MTDSGKQRPRSAFSVDDAQPDGVDDTRSMHADRARRGATDDIDSPFTRPVTSAQETVVPAPVLPGTERRAAPGSGVGRRGVRWNGLNDETTPAERDSIQDSIPSTRETATHAAVSPAAPPPPRTTPQRQVQQPTSSWSGWPDQQPSQPARAPYQPPATTAHHSPARAADPEPEPDSDTSWAKESSRTYRAKDSVPSTSWFSHHKRMLTTWVVAAVSAAVLIAGGVFVFSRMTAQSSAGNANPSASEVNSEPVNLTDTSLLDTSDASLIDPAASWTITQTITEKGKDTLHKVNCLSSDPMGINTTATLQRTIGTQQDDKLALMHQVDAYANEETAKKIYEHRATSLASCSAIPALIAGSSTVTGLGDEVLQMSVVQEDSAQHHTILLVRTGKVISMLDVARNNSGVDPKSAADALQRPLTTTCETAAGTCPTTPAIAPAAPPAADPHGWLIPNDIPIIAPGHLAWIGSGVKEVDFPGMGCEGMNLVSEQGPTDRKQRSYVVGSSDEALKGFGITQYRFAFADETAATAFGDLLSENLASCAARSSTAKVTELSPVTTDGSDGPAVTARVFNATQQNSDDAHKPYQLVVARTGAAVSYLVFTPTEENQFTEEQLKNLTIRLGQRTAQG